MSDETKSGRSFSESLDHLIQSVSESMGFGSDFLHDLKEENDDWSFVVKLHSVLEAAVNDLLTAKLTEPGLASLLIERFQLRGRIDTLERIGAIDKDTSQQMRTLGKLRNDLVHDVHQTQFKFMSLVDTEGKRKHFAETYIAADWRELLKDHADDHPDWRARYALFLSVIDVVGLTVTEMRAKRALDGLKQALANEA